MTKPAFPKPAKARKEKGTGLQRKKPLRANTFLNGKPRKGKPHKKRTPKASSTHRIPANVMKAVKERSRGYDEMDGMPGANQGHHIKQRSLGGLDLAINILHVSERNHPYRLHETQEGIETAKAILDTRIADTFWQDKVYNEDEVAELLETKTILILQQANKGFLKATVSREPEHLYDITPDEITRWLRA